MCSTMVCGSCHAGTALPARAVAGHEVTNALLGLGPKAPALPELADQLPVVGRLATKIGLRKVGAAEEGVNVMKDRMRHESD